MSNSSRRKTPIRHRRLNPLPHPPPTTRPTVCRRPPMRADAVPALIAHGGDAAVRAYHRFLDDPIWSPRTCSAYRQSIGRFMRWAEERGLNLQTITAADSAAYAAEIAARSSRQAACSSLTPLRGLFLQ